MRFNEVLMIAAVFLAPFFAVFAQKQIEIWREHRSRKMWVFKMLMATRGRALSPEHVQALNVIDLEFTGKSEQLVRSAWKEYLDHLNSFPRGEGKNEAQVVVWSQRKEELLSNMLGEMGKSLGYTFDPVQIRKGAYSPEGHAVAEFELQMIRQKVLEWLDGGRKVLVSLTPADEEAAAEGKKFLKGVSGVFEGEVPIKIRLVEDAKEEPSPQG